MATKRQSRALPASQRGTQLLSALRDFSGEESLALTAVHPLPIHHGCVILSRLLSPTEKLCDNRSNFGARINIIFSS